MLYLITKLQNLKAIHNYDGETWNDFEVVSNYKITKSESYSQLAVKFLISRTSCI